MRLRSISTFLALAAILPPGVAQLTVVPMISVSVCGGPTLTVGYTATTVFNTGNIFSVQLSDQGGSFTAPTTIGSVEAVGSGTIPCTFPAGIIGGSGQAIRVVASDPAEIGDAYVLPVTTVVPPNAGLDSTTTVCSNSGSLDLLAMLSGIPDSGGDWSGPVGPVPSGLFDPTSDPSGLYTYVIPATPPCLLAAANLFLVVTPAPVVGTGGTMEVCAGSPPFNMFAHLEPGTNFGGMWTGPGGTVDPGVYQPGVSLPGCYTYTVPGIAPCANASVSLCITEVASLSAGNNASVNWCQSFGPLDLMAELGGSPAAGGTWSDDDTTGQLNGGTWDPTGMPSGTYSFTYSVGGGSCPVSSATVTVHHSGVCLLPPQTNDPVE